MSCVPTLHLALLATILLSGKKVHRDDNITDEKIKEIVKQAAEANNVTTQAISTSSIIDSSGHEAIKVVLLVPPGSSLQLVGTSSASVVVQVMRELADAGEERFPIVQFGERK